MCLTLLRLGHSGPYMAEPFWSICRALSVSHFFYGPVTSKVSTLGKNLSKTVEILMTLLWRDYDIVGQLWVLGKVHIRGLLSLVQLGWVI